MKRIIFLCGIVILPMLMQAQQMMSDVSITINGNKNLQMTLDGKPYDLKTGTSSGNVSTLSANNLSFGQHAFLFTRTDNSNVITEKISALINLRYGYDMTIVLNEDGSLEFIESRKEGYASITQQPMGVAPFNSLLQQVKVQKSTAKRKDLVAAAFDKSSNYFTTLQVEQLLKQINAESFRLSLAKDAFGKVTDPYNFGNIYSLLASAASKKNLDTYISNFERKEIVAGTGADTDFKSLYQTIQQQWPVSTQMSSLNDAFSNPNNSFTTQQAAQLIQLVSAEGNRLILAKASYRSITDKANFLQLNDLLNTQNSRNELQAYVQGQGGNGAGNPMSASSFTNLYKTVQQQWPVSTQMNSLNDAFNNTNNHFTTSQAVQLIKLVSAETNRLQLAKASYRSITDKGNFGQVNALLNMQSSRNELQDYVEGTGGTNANGMSETSFSNLYRTVQQQWPVSTQMNSLNDAFSNTNNIFTTSQAIQLIKLVSAETNRLQLAKASYRSITDKANFFQTLDLLNMQSSKDELQDYVQGNAGTNAGSAMSESAFTNMYKTIQQQWPVSTQMNSLNDVFNNTNNHFTTYQAVQLIKLVSSETNRLQLAKASYRSITDKGSFGQTNNLFNLQSSRNELDDYVRNYGANNGNANGNGNGNTNSNTKQPMSDAGFADLYQRIQMQFMPFEKMSSMTDLFSNSSDYFTTAQAQKLIQMVTMESNRLSLATNSYKKITDRNNFGQMYDLFTTQASKDELANYVKSYRD